MPLRRKVWEFMVKEPPTVSPSDSVGVALQTLDKVNETAPGIQSLIVADPNTGSLKGVVTLRRIMDGLRKAVGHLKVEKGSSFWESPELEARLKQETELVRVKDVMSKRIQQVKPYDSIGSAVNMMLDKKVRGVPVVENEKVIGVLRMVDIFKHLQKQIVG